MGMNGAKYHNHDLNNIVAIFFCSDKKFGKMLLLHKKDKER